MHVGLHYHSVLIRCRNTYSNDTSCSEECIMAQNSLASGTKEGRRFAQCTCTGGTVEDVQLYCQNLDKVFSCIRSDVITDAVNTTVLCNDARRYCEDDWVCRDALHYYEVACEQSERKNRARPNACPTQRCQDSYEILMRQNHADNLRGCDCAEASLRASPGWVYCFDVAKLVSCEVATVMPTFVNKASSSCNDNLSVVLLRCTIFVFCSFLYSELFAQQI